MADERPTLAPGTVAQLHVARTSPLGAFLDANTGSTDDDILLHRNQQTRPVRKGETLDVYLYLDNQERLTASMRLPRLQEGQLGWVTVKSTSHLGAFLDIGTEKDVLLPHKEMVEPKPARGEIVLVYLYADKSGRLAATMDVEGWLSENYEPSAGTFSQGDTVKVRPYLISQRGASCVTEGYHWGMIPGDQSEALTRGKTVEATVTRVDSEGRLNLSLSRDRGDARLADAQVILEVLQRRGGDMPYSDASPPQVIMDRFGLSKGAFKRALGKLLAEGLVAQEGGWTKLLK